MIEDITKQRVCNLGRNNVQRNRKGRGFKGVPGSAEFDLNRKGKERCREYAYATQDAVGNDLGSGSAEGVRGFTQSIIQRSGEIGGSKRVVTAGEGKVGRHRIATGDVPS